MVPFDCPAGGYTSDYVWFWIVAAALGYGTWRFFRRTRDKKGLARVVVGNLLLLLVVAWTGVVLGETYLRYVYDRTDQYGLTMTNRAWFIRHEDPNANGFRDVEWTAAKAPGATRVVFLGDSFAWGWGVADKSRAFPALVRAGLDARFPGRFDVRNYGQPGMSTTQEAAMFEDIVLPEAAPDRVVVAYCLNDPDDLLPPGRTFDRDAALVFPLFGRWRSFVADYLWFHLRLADDPKVKGYFDWVKEAYDDPAIWDQERAQFKRLADDCKAKSIRLDVVVFPFFQRWGAAYDFDACHDAVAAAWKRLGVDVIDLRETYRGIDGRDLVVNKFDAHPNERAHDLAAKTILARAFEGR